MDPNNPGMLPPGTSSGYAALHHPAEVTKVKKAKKHKKHHRHDDGESPAMSGGGAPGAAAGLKLKIKLGDDPTSGGGGSGHPKKKKKKKDKKKKHHHKEKRKREHESALGSGGNGADGAPRAKEPRLEPVEMAKAPEIPIPPTTSSSSSAETTKPSAALKTKPLYRLLDYLLPCLKKRDTHSFFALPVEDKFAPGYSQIIKQPMDFSTIRSRLDAGAYTALDAFRRDFKLMCDNAMTYNALDTIYYKTAKRLQQTGARLLTQEKLAPMRHHMEFMEEITEEELGFDVMADPVKSDGDLSEDDDEDDDDDDDGDDVSRVIEDIRGVVRRPPGRFDAIPDDMNPGEILEQARKAAEGAAEKLKLHKPKSQMGFLRQKSDGTTSLSFLTGGDGVLPGTERDRPVTLGSLIGKVKQGTGSIAGLREDRRNVAKPVYPLHYGAFSSHGPTFDSTFANLTKEETEMVHNTYGDEVGVQYAESILNFSRNCDYAMSIVDHLLDILTGNEHRKTSKYIEEMKMLRKEDEVMDRELKNVKPAAAAGRAEEGKSEDKDGTKGESEKGEEKKEEDKEKEVDFGALKSLSDDGIDMSFLDALKDKYEKEKEEEEEEKAKKPKEEEEPTQATPEEMLSKTASLLEDLKRAQHERLSATPPQHFSSMPKAGEKECKLAAEVQSSLVDMAKRMEPGNVATANSVRRLLGIPPVKEEEDVETSAPAVPAAAEAMEV